MSFPSNEIPDFDGPAKATIASPLEAAISRNEALIGELAEQLVILDKKLQPISSPRNVLREGDEASGEDRAPESPTVERLRSQGNRLSELVAQVSYTSRNLEV